MARLNIILTAAFGLLLFITGGSGLLLLASLFAAVVIFISAPIFFLGGKRRLAGRLLAGWGIYAMAYLAISTGIAVFQSQREHTLLAVGEEFCADAGCFAVDKVDRSSAAPASYTLSWHLSNTYKERSSRFPGKGLELYLFDERGRIFRAPVGADPNPLDVTMMPGETVHRSMTFDVSEDARDLFLTARYRPFTFQSLLLGDLSVVPLRSSAMIRVQ